MNQSVTGVLFDIDGTLLHSNYAGRRAFSEAIGEVFGWDDDLRHIQFAGNTDARILNQIADARNATFSEEQLAAFYRRMEARLETHMVDDVPSVYPGVSDLLEALAAAPDVFLGLVTGNVETCARVKLRGVGLNDYFSFGGYGHEHWDRAVMADLALNRLRARLEDGQTLKQCFLIGDTPSDIDAANKTGMVSVGVATGVFCANTLSDAGAAYVVEDLSDTRALFDLFDLVL